MKSLVQTITKRGRAAAVWESCGAVGTAFIEKVCSSERFLITSNWVTTLLIVLPLFNKHTAQFIR